MWDVVDGAPTRPRMKWFDLARRYAAERWEDDAATTREGIAALATATLALLDLDAVPYTQQELRAAMRWALLPGGTTSRRRSTRSLSASCQNTRFRWLSLQRVKCRNGSAESLVANWTAVGWQQERRGVVGGRSTQRLSAAGIGELVGKEVHRLRRAT
jgi:hypothetical protein